MIGTVVSLRVRMSAANVLKEKQSCVTATGTLVVKNFSVACRMRR